MFYRERFYDQGSTYVIVDAYEFRRSGRPKDPSLERAPRHEARWMIEKIAAREPQLFARLYQTLLGVRLPGSGGFSLRMVANTEALVARMLDAFGASRLADSQHAEPDFARFYLLRSRRTAQPVGGRPDSPEGRRIGQALAKLGGGALTHRGAAYRLQRAGQAESAAGNRGSYETLSEAQLLSVLRELSAEPGVEANKKSAIVELLAAAEEQRAKNGSTELLLLRPQRFFARAESEGPSITPSQMRKAREVHWVEILLEDKRLGALAGEAFEITLPDGRKQQAATNGQGLFRVDSIASGTSRILFRPTKGHPPKNADTEWSTLELGVQGGSDEQHRFVVDHNRAEIVEIDDGQFCPNSSILAPSDDAHGGSDGLSMVAHALRYARDNTGRKLMIVGHADTQEGDRASLAGSRAKVLEALLKGDAKAFAAACIDPNQAATPRLLAWAHERHRYDCDPTAPVAAKSDAEQSKPNPVQAALARFRRAHNQKEKTQLEEAAQGMAGDDYEAIFKLFERSLADLLDVEPSELSTLRGKLKFHSVATLAAEVAWPKPAGAGAKAPRSRSSRRVDLMFLENDRPIPDIAATAIPAEHFYVDERRVRRVYVPPLVSIVVVTPYAGADIDRGADAEFKLVGPGYSRAINVSDQRNHVEDFFDVKYVELRFHGAPAEGTYKLTTTPKGGAESVLFEGVPFEALVGATEDGA